MDKRQKNPDMRVVFYIALGIFLVLLAWFGFKKDALRGPGETGCTADALQCPDGSYVGRTGPNCEFAACPTVGSETSENDTAGWKTYRNEQYGFEFRYPSRFEVNQELQDLGYDGVNMDNFNHQYGHGGITPPEGAVFVVTVSEGESIDDFLQKIQRYRNEKDKIIEEADIVVAGHPAKKIIEDIDFTYFQERIIKVAFVSNGSLYKIGMNYYPNDSLATEFFEEFEQILSTFKFLDENAVDTSNWKTYRNEEYGFEVMHPMNYMITTLPEDPLGSYLSEVSISANDGSFGAEIYIWKNIEGKSDIAALRNQIVKYYGASQWPFSFPWSDAKISELSLGDYPAVMSKYGVPREGSGMKDSAVVVFALNAQYVYRIGYMPDIQIGNQILSTFKFTK